MVDIQCLFGWLRRLALLLAIMAPSIATGVERSSVSRVVAWFQDFEAGMEAAGRTKRPALVYFQAKWCTWCHVFERDVLAHPRVVDVIMRHYVPVLVNYDARPELFRRLGGRGLPHMAILSPDGVVRTRLPGILGVEDTIAVLEAAASGGYPQADIATTDSEAPARLDVAGFQAFRQAYLDRLDRLYDPATGGFTGILDDGTPLKRPAPLVWRYLTERGLWTRRTREAARVARTRLYDPVDGGWFYFRDPYRPDEHLETAKLLDVNVWMAAWMALAGRAHDDPVSTGAAAETLEYLRRVLWDATSGGFWQAQIADPAYYRASPQRRARLPRPPVDRIKRTDSNAQAAWVLMELGELLGDAQARALAVATLDYLLQTHLREGRLYHVTREGARGRAFNLPQDLFWTLAAGYRIQETWFDAGRHERLRGVLRLAVEWVKGQRRSEAAETHPVDLYGLVAWVVANTDQSLWPDGTIQWALDHLRIEADTRPQDLVWGLIAWERIWPEEFSGRKGIPAYGADSIANPRLSAGVHDKAAPHDLGARGDARSVDGGWYASSGPWIPLRGGVFTRGWSSLEFTRSHRGVGACRVGAPRG